jgi:hypothetical protein
LKEEALLNNSLRVEGRSVVVLLLGEVVVGQRRVSGIKGKPDKFVTKIIVASTRNAGGQFPLSWISISPVSPDQSRLPSQSNLLSWMIQVFSDRGCIPIHVVQQQK